MGETQYDIVCLFARERGLVVLKWLLSDPRFNVTALVVHSKLPKSEDCERGLRPEFPEFQKIADENGIPLYTVDTKSEAKELSCLEGVGSFHFLTTVSWRFLVPERVFSRATIAPLNMHRGKLPQYAGAEPIKQALENGDTAITLTVHEMVAELDAGEILVEKEYIIEEDSKKSLPEKVECIKEAMLPLYPKALDEALTLYIERHYE